MTVLELIEALEKLDRGYGNLEVTVRHGEDVLPCIGVTQEAAPYHPTGPILDPEHDVVILEVRGYR